MEGRYETHSFRKGAATAAFQHDFLVDTKWKPAKGTQIPTSINLVS